ncbi:MAG: ester cyclase [Actinomycetota bacterium]|nr:ester cyclase [Actinomycetota bacterium]
MTRERNISSQEQMGQAINTGQLDQLDDVMSPSVVDHDPAPDQGPGLARFEDGRIVERWGSSDGAGIMKQLGQT